MDRKNIHDSDKEKALKEKALKRLRNMVVSALDIATVVTDYGVSLKKSGNGFVGLCPFHDDHNPSFVVYPNHEEGAYKGIYKCFACGAQGDVVQFVAEIENISEEEALYKLIEEYKIDVDALVEKASKGRFPGKSVLVSALQMLQEQRSLRKYVHDEINSVWNVLLKSIDGAAIYEPLRTKQAMLVVKDKITLNKIVIPSLYKLAHLTKTPLKPELFDNLQKPEGIVIVPVYNKEHKAEALIVVRAPIPSSLDALDDSISLLRKHIYQIFPQQRANIALGYDNFRRKSYKSNKKLYLTPDFFTFFAEFTKHFNKRKSAYLPAWIAGNWYSFLKETKQPIEAVEMFVKIPEHEKLLPLFPEWGRMLLQKIHAVVSNGIFVVVNSLSPVMFFALTIQQMFKERIYVTKEDFIKALAQLFDEMLSGFADKRKKYSLYSYLLNAIVYQLAMMNGIVIPLKAVFPYAPDYVVQDTLFYVKDDKGELQLPHILYLPPQYRNDMLMALSFPGSPALVRPLINYEYALFSQGKREEVLNKLRLLNINPFVLDKLVATTEINTVEEIDEEIYFKLIETYYTQEENTLLL